MPVYVHQPDALDRLAAVEGPGWRAEQQTRAGVTPPASFETFLCAWYRLYISVRHARAFGCERDAADYFERIAFLNVPIPDEDGRPAIRGAAGTDQYAVLRSGEIRVIRELCPSLAHLLTAEREGFRPL